MRTLNLGIVAHVDAGKTSLTERLLHAAGVIERIGRVDDGTTQTDTLALERQRGITIRSAVVAFEVAGVTINLIDTPGHPDFIAEVERVLGVLDGAVLVVSAVEGVQAQTRILLRALRRLRIPTLIFVNKIDRPGARPEAVAAEIAAGLQVDAYPMGEVTDAGTSGANFRRTRGPEEDHLTRTLTAELALHPTFFGSAVTGAGVPELITGLVTLLPVADHDRQAPLAGTVFTIQRAPNGEKLSYVAIRCGTLRTRQRLGGPRGVDRITGLELFEAGTTTPVEALPAGRIGRVRGLHRSRIGDPVGASGTVTGHPFGPPTLESVVVPVRRENRGRLAAALEHLAEQDPLIGLRTDERRGHLAVSLFGEVQKEVLTATLLDEYGVAVAFETTTPVCVERLTGEGAAAQLIGTPDNPFLATVGLRVAPGSVGSGVDFGLEVELGSMPAAFMRAVEETVLDSLRQGPHGWEIPDVVVRLTHSGYYPRQSHSHGTFDKSMSSTAGDFRHLTQLVLAAAVRQAGTRVCAPVQRVELGLPADALTAVLPALIRLGGVPLETIAAGPATYRVHGELPTAAVHELTQLLPALSHGEGVLETAFSHYAPVTNGAATSGPPPERERTDDDPYHRVDFLRAVSQRVALRR